MRSQTGLRLFGGQVPRGGATLHGSRSASGDLASDHRVWFGVELVMDTTPAGQPTVSGSVPPPSALDTNAPSTRARSGAKVKPNWREYRWTPQVRRGFIGTYVFLGSFLALFALLIVDSIQRHRPGWALWPGAFSALLLFYLSRAAYRHVWLRSHNQNVGRIPAVGERIWDAVRSNRVLTEAERPTAQVGADKLLWGPARLFRALVFPGISVVWLLDHLLHPGFHRSPVETAYFLVALVVVLAGGWAFVMQARLRRWMDVNGLVRKK